MTYPARPCVCVRAAPVPQEFVVVSPVSRHAEPRGGETVGLKRDVCARSTPAPLHFHARRGGDGVTRENTVPTFARARWSSTAEHFGSDGTRPSDFLSRAFHVGQYTQFRTFYITKGSVLEPDKSNVQNCLREQF